ncbi:hypothetical protein LSTR_LSTR002209 [Laodelphax striatellus]|uniref:TATA-box-binding protein n=1 Tax=Laodelphax striatellus TaxID=195883 RepID=A0A482XEY7_LAOST|nr:hypothetical protein LSTR_LSTR002209 [Laodelphax striatellus]
MASAVEDRAHYSLDTLEKSPTKGNTFNPDASRIPSAVIPSTSPKDQPCSSSTNATPQAVISYVPPALNIDSGPVPTVQNVVSTVNTSCTLDLRKINFYTRNSEYNPSRFCGIVMRLREPRATALIFSSGKIVTTGTKHESSALLASRKFVRIIQKLGFNVKFQNFKIHNMVSTCDLRFPIRLENLNQVHGQFSSYEPELFPALIYRMVKPRVVLLIFVNGKVVITGAKSREETQEALDNIHKVLKSFRKS